ncbi:MAG: outer membrane lipoprotein carrier protein LolA [Candidatus Amulumruptor caecigallinarius]|nr:outer membrane lipoprotein carrier protein LolA [Candidatus Amulumruptor caecigallinarius]
MKRFFAFILVLLSGAIICNAVSPEVEFKNALSKIRNSKSVSCKFRTSANGGNVSGSLEFMGKKFKLVSPIGTTWYDGHTMWTENTSTKEVTAVIPTADELIETNPVGFIDSSASDFRFFYSKRKEKDVTLILLNPKKSGSSVKAVEVALSKKTGLPVRIIVRDSNDRRVTVNVTDIKLGKALPGSYFKCPESVMKNNEFVDLR